MSEAEEAAQMFPSVHAKYRCRAWPECGTYALGVEMTTRGVVLIPLGRS